MGTSLPHFKKPKDTHKNTKRTHAYAHVYTYMFAMYTCMHTRTRICMYIEIYICTQTDVAYNFTADASQGPGTVTELNAPTRQPSTHKTKGDAIRVTRVLGWPFEKRNSLSRADLLEKAMSATMDQPHTQISSSNRSAHKAVAPGLKTVSGHGMRYVRSKKGFVSDPKLPEGSPTSTFGTTMPWRATKSMYGLCCAAWAQCLRMTGYEDAWRMRTLVRDFMAEMRVLAKLRHPNITTVIGAVMDAHCPLLVMEYLEHGSLFDVLHNDTVVIEAELLMPMLKDIVQVHARIYEYIHTYLLMLMLKDIVHVCV